MKSLHSFKKNFILHFDWSYFIEDKQRSLSCSPALFKKKILSQYWFWKILLNAIQKNIQCLVTFVWFLELYSFFLWKKMIHDVFTSMKHNLGKTHRQSVLFIRDSDREGLKYASCFP